MDFEKFMSYSTSLNTTHTKRKKTACTVRASPSRFTGAPASRYLVCTRQRLKNQTLQWFLHNSAPFGIIKHWEFMGLLGYDMISSSWSGSPDIVHERYVPLPTIDCRSWIWSLNVCVLTRFASKFPRKRYVQKYSCVWSRMPNPHFHERVWESSKCCDKITLPLCACFMLQMGLERKFAGRKCPLHNYLFVGIQWTIRLSWKLIL